MENRWPEWVRVAVCHGPDEHLPALQESLCWCSQSGVRRKVIAGCIGVDRYAGYNKAPCAIQYCYLLREVGDLEKEFPNSREVKTFVSTLAPLFSQATNLRRQDISDKEFSLRASEVKSQILAAVNSPAKHLGIQHIQDIFREA